MPELDVRGYLARLGVDDPGPPTVEALHELHRAQVERIPYENIEIQLGRPTTVDPYESAHRIIRHRRGGYCFHLNGAFSALLAALGYDVRWHVGGVQGRDEPDPVGARGNHLPLTVHGLGSRDCPDGVWLVDVGLGDGLHDPLPLGAGWFRQGPFAYHLESSVSVPGGWRFVHDPAGSFTGMDFGLTVASPADFATMHERLSTSPESGFVRVFSVQRRDASGADILRGCVLTRLEGEVRHDTELADRAAWRAVLADVFGLMLDDIPGHDLDQLWSRVREAHDAWLASHEARGAPRPDAAVMGVTE